MRQRSDAGLGPTDVKWQTISSRAWPIDCNGDFDGWEAAGQP